MNRIIGSIHCSSVLALTGSSSLGLQAGIFLDLLYSKWVFFAELQPFPDTYDFSNYSVSFDATVPFWL